MSRTKLTPAAAVAVILVAVLCAFVSTFREPAGATDTGGMAAMSIDLDPDATPANARAAEYGQACANALDDDTDTRVNDGCPTMPAAVGAPESGFACNDLLIAIDNDLDGVANDGCGETSCLESVDNDGDGVVNDGCPTYGTATLGSRETCGRINENGLLDADEDGEDAILLDVTATDIPATHPMMAYAFTLDYPAAALTVESHDPNFLLATYPRSGIFDVSQPVPDDNEDSQWSAAVADLNDQIGERGSGVLSRLLISSEEGQLAGLHSLTLREAGHVDPENNSHAPQSLNHAAIAVDQPCPAPVP